MNPGSGGGGGSSVAARSGEAILSGATNQGVSTLLCTDDADVDANNHARIESNEVPMQRSMYGTLIEDHRGEEQERRNEQTNQLQPPPPPPRVQDGQARRAGYSGLQRQLNTEAGERDNLQTTNV